MFTLLIPTRNRPHSLGHVLRFIDRFFPTTKIVVADASDPHIQSAVKSLCAGFPALTLDFRSFAATAGYSQRIIDVLATLQDALVVIGADDDYPLIDVLEQAAQALRSKGDHLLAVGSYLTLTQAADLTITPRLRVAHPLDADHALDRVQRFTALTFPTTYSVARRTHLLHRYATFKSVFPLGLRDNSTTVQTLIDILASALTTHAGLSKNEATQTAKAIYAKKLAVKFGNPSDRHRLRTQMRKAAFEGDPMKTPFIQAQIRQFEDMKSGWQNHPTRAEILTFIQNAQLDLAQS